MTDEHRTTRWNSPQARILKAFFVLASLIMHASYYQTPGTAIFGFAAGYCCTVFFAWERFDA